MPEIKIANENTSQAIKNSVHHAQESLMGIAEQLNILTEKANQISDSAGGLWCGNAAGTGDQFILTTGLNLTELTAGHKFTFFTDRYSSQPEILVDSCPPYILNAKIRGMGVITMAFADHHFYCETAQIHDDLDGLHDTMNLVSADAAIIKSSSGDANVKIGANTDAAGTATLFARLQQIYSHLSLNLSATRAGYIDTTKTTTDTINTTASTVNTKVGTNTDAGGTTTLFARLNQIYTYLTTNMSTTRMGNIDAMKGTIDTMATNINSIKTAVSGGRNVCTKIVIKGSTSMAANGIIVQSSKPGWFDSVLLSYAGSAAYVRIYLDDILAFQGSLSASTSDRYYLFSTSTHSGFSSTTTAATIVNCTDYPISWSKSMKIDINAAGNVTVTGIRYNEIN